MAKYLFLACFFVIGCRVSDDGDGIAYGYIQVSEAVVVGEVKSVGEATKIHVKYTLANSCQEFIQFQTLKNENKVMEIAILGSTKQSKECVIVPLDQNREISFKPTIPGEYIFKFWSGANEFKTLTLIVNKN